MRGAWLLCVAALGCGGGDDPPADANNVGVPGTYTISGIVRYEDRAPLPSGALADPAPVIARGVSIALIAETSGDTLAMGVTDDTGAYSLTFDGVGGEQVHVLAAASSSDAMRPISVRRADNNQIHGFGGAVFGVDNLTHDVLITIDSGAAGAFNIFDQLVIVMDRVRAIYPQQPVPVRAFWHEGNGDGTYYTGNEMYLLGEQSDDDGFDDTVIMHEAGHYVEDAYGRSDSPGGGHDGSPTDPNLAWSEGFSTYFALALRDEPIYMDSNADGGWAYNAETSVFRANANGGIAQDVSEDMVAEILWDMGDPGGDDPLDGTHDPVLSLMTYVRAATLRTGNEPGVDLVDALDGWFVDNGLASCAAMRTIVNTTHTFPYDYGGPGGTCPP
jgi:hypothetical protein